MTPDLDQLEALLAKATPGPWEARGMTVLGPPEYTGVAMCYWPTLERDTPPITLANAALIAAAVNALPAMIARVRELECSIRNCYDSSENQKYIGAERKEASIKMRERAAQACEALKVNLPSDPLANAFDGACETCAAAIRALEV